MVPLPPVEASPNGRLDRRRRIGGLAAYRDEVALLAREAARREGWSWRGPVRLSMVWGIRGGRAHDGRYRPADVDNAVAAAKPLIDGLRLAGVIADDRWELLELGQVRAERGGGPWVRVVLEVAGHEEAPG
ncbi:MAG: hypothetical protein N2109_06940 [Fimbriimonadales bacterium]|nr:hypothetical protein [Fimbriimonadales bacterium]GIW17455.1 MAG: hypothetical protein KatS3mg064_0612 [Tepidiforma sp.]